MSDGDDAPYELVLASPARRAVAETLPEVVATAVLEFVTGPPSYGRRIESASRSRHRSRASSALAEAHSGFSTVSMRGAARLW